MTLAESAHALRTDFAFTLPLGYVDEAGAIHRECVMRRATALDEIQPLQDPRAQANQAYLGILLLSRVLVRLGTISPVTPTVVEGLFSADFGYLQDVFLQLNEPAAMLADTRCPGCGTQFTVDLGGG
jgi:hypothetical protein